MDSKTEFAWLIEDDCYGEPEWWTADARIPWTRDAFRAVRFSRRQDADAVIAGREPVFHAWKDRLPMATEHGFAPLRAPEPPAVEIAWLGRVDQGMGHWHYEIADPHAENAFPVYSAPLREPPASAPEVCKCCNGAGVTRLGDGHMERCAGCGGTGVWRD